ncbi:MAG: hypothetical protein LBC60_04960 [Spirochaetaceae bacterium]|jgi:hypothetical protein|nr:hypothetical protein [Spirochaetaceae bacterium]
MKKTIPLIAVLGTAALIMAGCASKPKAEETPTPAEIRREQAGAEVETQPRPSTVLDWADRNLGEGPVPLWLKPLIKGNAEPVKTAFGVSADARVKYSVGRRVNREEARVQAGLLFAAQLANELKTYVMTAAAQTLDEGRIDLIEEITAAAKVNVTGAERVADFWQLVETEDPRSRGVKSPEYVYYVVWAMSRESWTALTRKYVNDVIGRLPDRAVQTNVARAYEDIQAAADREIEMSDAEFLQRLHLQEQAAEAARDRARTNQGAGNRYTAYKAGGNDAAAAAATEADYDWISALSAASEAVF